MAYRIHEYVHLCEIRPRPASLLADETRVWATYEPLDHEPRSFSLMGTIYISDETEPAAQITPGLRRWDLCIEGLDGIELAVISKKRILILWEKEKIPEHYLCVSYEFAESEMEHDWKSEGF